MTAIPLHRSVLLQTLHNLYVDPLAAPWLGFKGGTCLHFLHHLPRFSTDLDFSLLADASPLQPKHLRSLLEKTLIISDEKEKANTWFWLGSYPGARWNVKIEISKRIFPDTFETLDLYGLTLRAMDLPSILAHKLCAITDRKALANRDLFDAHFLLSQHSAINDVILMTRTGLETAEYLTRLLTFIPKNVSRRGMLDGLGELLEEEQKQWVRAHLLEEVLFLLRARIDSANDGKHH
jgi:predicted nucleotidyltransferase component of viral defense system